MENTENVKLPSFLTVLFSKLPKRTWITIGIILAICLVLFFVGIFGGALKIRSDAKAASEAIMKEKSRRQAMSKNQPLDITRGNPPPVCWQFTAAASS